jgi:hypothetical protein
LGIIEALSAGLDAVVRHPWLLLIPLLLDLFLWMGPRLQAPGLYRSFEPALRQLTTQMATSEARYAAQELGKAIEQFFTQFNLFAWLSVGLIGVPVINGGIDATLKLVTGSPPILWQMNGFSGYFLTFVIFTMIGLLIAALYWTLLGDFVRGEPLQRVRWLRQSIEVWKKLLVLMMSVLSLVFMSIFPLSMVMFMFSMFSAELASLVPLLAIVAAAWIILICLFTPHGLVVHHLPLGRAIQTSILIVRTNFVAVVGLIVIVSAISIGMGLIWEWLAADSWLRLIAMAGNALIGTGLIVASLLFYRNRVVILFESHHWPLPAGR